MSFKKLNPEIKDALITNDIEAPTSFQKLFLPKIKSGIDIYGIGKKGVGKTTAMIIGTMQMLGSKAFEDAPRALILVEDKQAALDLQAAFLEFTSRTDLRIYTAYEEHDLEKQKEEIYYGQDIVIATPKRLNKLFFLNAINVTQLKLFIIEDAEFAIKAKYYNDVIRVPESLEKCQFLIFAEELYPKLQRLDDLFMFNAMTIKV
ncbi:DEAD/DEAH box helicase [Bizionia paragorgiae]|uniref:DEAD/DEAH box helicase n=1 Tax=Bizionia paragorgiae TaxID=283786 RepID=A0A1H3X6K3_BIZPA|nr:DEAD/DEAH box helicase [Bizionia paragorgiae]SDZ94581.1 DEAD/DEAH box helicase [Bizionia paragorgiae]